MDSMTLNIMPWEKVEPEEAEALLSREWLVTNGLGGYASGSVSGVCTRRYHGFLIAALPAPFGRTLMLNHLAEEIRLPDGKLVQLSGEELDEASLQLHSSRYLAEFRLEMGLPVWRYEFEDFVLERRVLMPHLQNTVHVTYRLSRGRGLIRLRIRPSLHFRPHEAPVSRLLEKPYQVTSIGERYEVSDGSGLPSLRLNLISEAGAFLLEGGRFRGIFYRLERRRGYDCQGVLWSPGYFRTDLKEGDEATLVGSTESWETILALKPQEAWDAEQERRQRLLAQAHAGARSGPAAELVLAGDQFIVVPTTRLADAARAYAAGDEARTIVAGYHWFTDWGRDTMISLEGLALITGRHVEAGYILRTFAQHVRDGLIPNLFPEGEREGLYHTADATLWFFHAIDRYLQYTGDRLTLRLLLPTLLDIVDHHLRGTSYGIGSDPKDGLLRQGQEGYQLTWMDAKVGDWVVTPRRGKAVEINALWYNALRLLERWVREERNLDEARPLQEEAERIKQFFNSRFWYEEGGYLYDVVDGERGDDASLRPNQILAISLPHPVLEASRWPSVLEILTERLLTPVGLRSLDPAHPDYKAKYDGDLRDRDAAYHQGTVWPWLIGPFLDAWVKVHPEDKDLRRFLDRLIQHLGEACIGSIGEIFDAEPPFHARGCIAQAWSVAELLRCWVKAETLAGAARSLSTLHRA